MLAEIGYFLLCIVVKGGLVLGVIAMFYWLIKGIIDMCKD